VSVMIDSPRSGHLTSAGWPVPATPAAHSRRSRRWITPCGLSGRRIGGRWPEWREVEIRRARQDELRERLAGNRSHGEAGGTEAGVDEEVGHTRNRTEEGHR